MEALERKADEREEVMADLRTKVRKLETFRSTELAEAQKEASSKELKLEAELLTAKNSLVSEAAKAAELEVRLKELQRQAHEAHIEKEAEALRDKLELGREHALVLERASIGFAEALRQAEERAAEDRAVSSEAACEAAKALREAEEVSEEKGEERKRK